MGDSGHPTSATSVAIVGLAGRFPAARSASELWRLLVGEREATLWLTDEELLAAGESPDALRDQNYVRAAMPLPDMDMFDAGFFGFTAREAAILDPQHRQFLEACWEALEDSGHPPARFKGSIGVFAGCGMQAYFARNLLPNRELAEKVGFFLLRHTGNDKDFLTTRVSYLLNLQGPSVGIQTACSTSLVAVHVACQSLLAGESDMALAGGVSIEVPHMRGYRFAEGEILSSTGKCRAFDDSADGVVFGSGVGVVVLRRLQDALADGDHIYAVIRGSAVNNDGASKAGYLAPSVEGQARAAVEALAVAQCDAEAVDYIEAHGTGTLVGDPIELAALSEAYGGTTRQIGIGSIKTNIGHLDTAAGVASLIKVALALKNEYIPASLNFERPNSRFDFAAGPFQVAARSADWRRSSRKRLAAVNSLGVGGTNAHVVVEEAPVRARAAGQGPHLVLLSAKTEASLRGLQRKWVDFLDAPPSDFSLPEAAFTTQDGREHFSHRLAIAAEATEDLLAPLRHGKAPGCTIGKIADKPRIIFMFPGGGAQFPGAGRALYERQPSFRAAADVCFEKMSRSVSADLRALMFERSADDEAAVAALEQPLNSVLAVFVLEYAMAAMWAAWGVRPDAMIGHSAGEYAAAVVAGVMSLEDALEVVALRGQVFAQAPAGGMLSVKAGVDTVAALAAGALDVAAVNGSQLTVMSGPDDALLRFAQRCTAQGIETSRVRIQVAAHSRMLDAALPRFRERVRTLKLSEPTIPIVSSRTGGWAGTGLLSDPEYWVGQLRETVQFAQGLSAALELADPILLEVGPGQGLCALARLADGRHEPNAVIATSRSVTDGRGDEVAALAAAGALWAHGAVIDFDALGARSKRRISLPTYAFEKQRYWIEPASETAQASVQRASAIERLQRPEDWISVPKWVARPLAHAPLSKDAVWLVLSDDGPVSQQFIEQLRAAAIDPVIVEAGLTFVETGPRHYQVAPASKADFDALLTALGRDALLPTHIAHLWSLNAPPLLPGAGVAQPLGFDSLFLLCQAMQLHGWEGTSRHLYGVTSKALGVNEDLPSHPERAALIGPCRVVPHEMPGLIGHVIDIDPHASPEAAAAEILAEAAASTRDEVVAFRGGLRLVISEEPVRSPPIARRLRDGGVYVITGGLGGIGLELCEYLARNSRARLVLLSRRGLPARASWEHLAMRRESPYVSVIQRLLEIEALGSEILVLQADITAPGDAARAVQEARARFGQIHGVFHLAGVIDDAPVASKSLASAHDVIAPKLAGALALDALLPPGSLDLFAVFSSTSVLMGPPGQIDYVAANAMLEALAARRSDGLALTSGIWNVGMAVRADTGSPPREGHPLLGACVARAPEWQFTSQLRPSTTWALRDHKVEYSAILPGAAYVDMIIEACVEAGFDSKVHIESINFIAALVCAGDTRRDVRTTILPQAGGESRVEIESRRSVGEAWTLHCEARVCAQPQRQVQPLARPNVEFEPLARERLTLDDRGVRFGPRWRSLRACRVYGRFAECDLQLPTSFTKELATHRAHPALLDVAATLGIFLLPTPIGHRGAWAPMSIESLTFVSRLPQRFHAIAHLRERETDQQATFDVDMKDPLGRSLLLVRGITLRWLDESAFHSATASAPQISPDASVFDQMLAAGFHAEDAPSAFDAALATNARHVVLSSIPLSKLRSLHTIKAAPEPAAAVAASSIAYADKIEAAIASMCIDILGVDSIRPEDEFLSFGAGSLAGVRLFGRIRKELGIELSLSALFKAPRLRDLADLVRAHISPDASQSAPAEVAPSSAWSPLVKIAAGGRHRRPLFCMPGAGGNVVTYKPLADRLAQDLPLYGLEARGVDGRAAFHDTIEEIAQCNLEAILGVDPHGPYRLAGYSGGGIVAFETAQRLQRIGRVVELMAMFDTLAPTEIHLPLTVAHNFKFFGQTSARFLLNWPGQRLADLVRGHKPEIESELELAGSRAFQSFLAAQKRYEVLSYRGDVLVFRAKHATRLYARAGDALGWDKLVNGRVEAVGVDAWHLTMFEPPAIDVLAAVLDAKLDALDSPPVQGTGTQIQSGASADVAK